MPTINQLVRQPRVAKKKAQQVASLAKMPTKTWRMLASENKNA